MNESLELFAREPVSSETSTTLVPLAERVRPRDWADFAVDDSFDSSLLTQLRAGVGVPPSLILWGPPGCGKTTLARLVGTSFQYDFVELSAVLAGVKDVRQIVATAKVRRSEGRGTILFVDEIHRFNKSQQDAFLPHIESGVVVLIGATTENPSFSLNNALLSRSRVVRFSPLTDECMAGVLQRAAATEAATLETGATELLVQLGAGDARVALNALSELIAHLRDHRQETASDNTLDITEDEAASYLKLRVRQKRYDAAGDAHYDFISAFIKSLRGSNPDAALYWGFQMLARGEPVEFLTRRLIIFASEDIGNADPRALEVAVNTAAAIERVGLPEGRIPLAQCICYLATAPKSNRSYMAMKAVVQEIERTGEPVVPFHLRNAPTALMKSEGYGQGYRYPHEEPFGFAQGVEYLPEGVRGGWYSPSPYGQEKTIGERLAFWQRGPEKS